MKKNKKTRKTGEDSKKKEGRVIHAELKTGGGNHGQRENLNISRRSRGYERGDDKKIEVADEEKTEERSRRRERKE